MPGSHRWPGRARKLVGRRAALTPDAAAGLAPALVQGWKIKCSKWAMEIRTPMNGIMGFSDILLEMENDDENKLINLIKISGRNLLEIINNI